MTAASPTRAGRGATAYIALGAVALGAVAVVLLALPYKPFDLERFFVPKEVALELAALAAALALLGSLRRCTVTRVDRWLAAYLALSALSSVLATNRWLAWRALAISLSGAALFWAARSLARAGLTRPVLAVLALAVATGALTALLQAYGVRSEYFSLNRAPGGTFGNRNFMAHLSGLGAPTLLLVALGARSRAGALTGAGGVAIVSAALVLSRTRAAWLALIVAAGVVALALLAARVPWRGAFARGRLRTLLAAASAGMAAAVFVPNTLDWRSGSPYLESMRGVVNYREGSGRGRVLQYRNTLRLAAAHPLLGVGPGNWAVAYPRVAPAGDPSLDAEPGMTANPWPSSDWMAFIAERGAIAAALLALVLLGLGAHAWLRLRAAATAEDALSALALGATVVIVLVVGAFDAVLLRAAPTLFVWVILGVLAEPRTRRAPGAVSERVRRWGVALVAVAGALALARGAGEMMAMSLATGDAGTRALERAARLDPASYRIQLRLSAVAAEHGRCSEVRAHALRASALYPAAVEPPRLLARCGAAARSRRARGE